MCDFKVGDVVYRKQGLRDGYWDGICDRYGIEPDEGLTVTKVDEYNIQLNGHEGFLANPVNFDYYIPTPASNPAHDAVKQPKHYELLGGEVIALIASSMTFEEFYGYCKGNILKYRLRAGKKDDALQDIGKADEYELLYEKYKHLCKVTLVEANNG